MLQGADAVRVLLIDEKSRDGNPASIKVYSAGELAEDYSVLDEQILEMMETEEQIIISNTNRMRRLNWSR